MVARKILWDISGAFGDIGVLIPIAIALVGNNGFNPTVLFAMAGVFYLVSAAYYRITMPVQPLKAMAAIAIASGLGVDVISVAGIMMGLILLGLSLSGLSERMGMFFPIGVIRGIQLGLGAILIKTSFQMIHGQAGYVVVAAVLLGAAFSLKKWIPPLLPILLVGLTLAYVDSPAVIMGPAPITLTFPAFHKTWEALGLLVLPQLALSFGNAIVATENTARLLYGRRASRVTLKSIPFGMGMANIAIGLLGGMPMCHGSGGLTAHAKLGATSARSGYIIGGALVILALAFGRSALGMISAFPTGFLAVLLFYVGASHAGFAWDIRQDRKEILVACGTAIVGLATSNLTYGFLFGIVLHKALTLRAARAPVGL
ncbi:MAG TPA: hypothetical protein DCS07_09485 [Bdellovibrionales bacterium]|nr:MAG: hypothetical protein A2Z97_05360 [Bdellovibrionales bacterium GWB1_52_6]OFZ05700.1 MAG: hypothetical protein A2X97_03265 [Bdellovibrionales bacterium GWA1_52_35]OFZ40651.1 MAG: hypothetical protein A2070_06275 [Bdellovibrionales bacterium GWC1_52_8]HAR42843.1 hypothetical protein [Bdellovibrionales bacterium]HCM40365.1 hypothetical protein [Bdellovibrionales bacterium]